MVCLVFKVIGKLGMMLLIFFFFVLICLGVYIKKDWVMLLVGNVKSLY